MAPRSHDARPISLALQGGGSHGALAWGVIDRLLDEEDIRIAEVSGTSAGAMNAVVLAHGLIQGGREGAREALHRYWKSVSDAARLSPIQRSAYDRLWGNFSLDNSPGYIMAESLSRIFSPYEINPFDINPLRDLLCAQVDFDALNAAADIRVHVTATNVRTGLAKVFSTGALSVDAALASACLPQMYQAVEIDGEAYWDGGFASNPALQPLVESHVTDILIVQLNPIRRAELPRTARDILNRVNEISFNTSLIKELRTIDLLQRIEAKHAEIDRLTATPVFLHMIHGEEDVQELAASSKLNAEWDYLQLLFIRGRRWAEDWLDHHRGDLGKRSSFQTSELFRPGELPENLPPITPPKRRSRKRQA